jgi:hypothetical protein
MKVIDGAWLTPAQMPGIALFGWVSQGKPQASSNPAMFAIDRILPMCVAFDPGSGASRWIGAQEQDFGSTLGTSASQITVIYPDSASAQAAYQRSLANCRDLQERTREWQAHPLGGVSIPVDAVVTQTATSPRGSAWSRHWTGFDGPSTEAGIQTNHQYIVQRGSVLTAVSFDEGPGSSTPASPYDTAHDAEVLAAIASKLCAYGGSC